MTDTPIKFRDERMTILLDEVKTTADGYRVVRSRVARTGLQDYRASEVGLSGNHIVTLYRPEEEVFADATVRGWRGVPVTVGHPSELVTPENVKELQVGDVRDSAHADRATGWFGLEWMLRDAASIAQFDSGEYAEVSGGYTSVLDWTPGVTADGRKYDGVQRQITPNHLAIVPRGRAFSDADIGDNWGAAPQLHKDHGMNMKAVVVGDEAVQVPADVADKITAAINAAKAEVATLAAQVADRDTTIGELKAENAETAKKVLSDADIVKLVAERKAVTDKAALFKIADEGQSIADIKRAAVKAHFGDDAASVEVSDAEINGIFRVMDADKADDTARKVIGDRDVNHASATDAVLKKYMKKEAK